MLISIAVRHFGLWASRSIHAKNYHQKKSGQNSNQNSGTKKPPFGGLGESGWVKGESQSTWRQDRWSRKAKTHQESTSFCTLSKITIVIFRGENSPPFPLSLGCRLHHPLQRKSPSARPCGSMHRILRLPPPL